jgi:hypothetical protein
MKLNEFEFEGKKYFHSPDLRTWDEWMAEKENGLYLLPKRRLYKIPRDLLVLLPGVLAGYRSTSGSFYFRDDDAYIWSSSQYDSTYAWCRYLYYSFAQVFLDTNGKANGFSAILERRGKHE